MPGQLQDELALRGLEDDGYDAVQAGDVDRFAAIRHPDLLYTHTSGITDTLESYTSKLRQRCYVYHSIEHPIDRIVTVHDVALVLGKMNAQITVGETEKQLSNTSLAVWVRMDFTWKLMAYHPTPKIVNGTTQPVD